MANYKMIPRPIAIKQNMYKIKNNPQELPSIEDKMATKESN